MSTFGVTGSPSYRPNNLLGFSFCAALLAFINLYISPQISLAECALCTYTRLTFLLMAGLFFIGFIFNSRWIQRVLSLLNLLLIGLAAVATVRSLLVQQIPASCEQNQTDLNLQNIDNLLQLYQRASICPTDNISLQTGMLSYAHLSLIALLILTVVVWKLVTKKAKRNSFFR